MNSACLFVDALSKLAAEQAVNEVGMSRKMPATVLKGVKH